MSAPSSAGLKKPGARAINRAEIVDQNFLKFLQNHDKEKKVVAGTVRTSGLSRKELLKIFDYQMLSRHLDLVAREMRTRNESFYTIGSAGHEGNAVTGYLTRPTDPAFLHYRSGGFMMARLDRAGVADPVYDTALSLAASRDDPTSGGRHKAWGSRAAWVLPQTSTIASHLPKAVGTAIALDKLQHFGIKGPVPADSIVALPLARHRQDLPLPHPARAHLPALLPAYRLSLPLSARPGGHGAGRALLRRRA